MGGKTFELGGEPSGLMWDFGGDGLELGGGRSELGVGPLDKKGGAMDIWRPGL